MDNKVILTVFGVIFLVGCFFFLFKSLQSHDQRQREEMERQRAEEQRQKEAEAAGAVVDPKAYEEQAKKRAEELKLQQAAAELKRAEERKRVELRRLQEEARRAKLKDEAAGARAALEKAAEDARRKAEEDRKAEEARIAEQRKRQELQDGETTKRIEAARVSAWLDSLATTTPPLPPPAFPRYVPTTSNTPESSSTTTVVTRDYSSTRTTRTSSNQDAHYRTWAQTVVLPFVRQALLDDARNGDAAVAADSAFGEITRPDLLKQLIGDTLAKALASVTEKLGTATNERTVYKGRMTMTCRSLENAIRQAGELLRQPETKDTTERDRLLVQVASDQSKACMELEQLYGQYCASQNQCRMLGLQAAQLRRARECCIRRAKELGLDVAAKPEGVALGPAAGTGGEVGAPAQKKAKVTVYSLKDGSKIRAVNVVKMGDQAALKDEKGNIHTVEMGDVVETTVED